MNWKDNNKERKWQCCKCSCIYQERDASCNINNGMCNAVACVFLISRIISFLFNSFNYLKSSFIYSAGYIESIDIVSPWKGCCCTTNSVDFSPVQFRWPNPRDSSYSEWLACSCNCSKYVCCILSEWSERVG